MREQINLYKIIDLIDNKNDLNSDIFEMYYYEIKNNANKNISKNVKDSTNFIYILAKIKVFDRFNIKIKYISYFRCIKTSLINISIKRY